MYTKHYQPVASVVQNVKRLRVHVLAMQAMGGRCKCQRAGASATCAASSAWHTVLGCAARFCWAAQLLHRA
jgi:hypothetical protein